MKYNKQKWYKYCWSVDSNGNKWMDQLDGLREIRFKNIEKYVSSDLLNQLHYVSKQKTACIHQKAHSNSIDQIIFTPITSI
jgi:hypothetical protein